MEPRPTNRTFRLRRRAASTTISMRFAIGAVVSLILAAQPTSAITVISKSTNTEAVWGLSTSQMEFENPLIGTETIWGHKILEWRDADYQSPAWYDDWTVSHPGSIDGNVSEIWMRTQGHSIWTSTNVNSRVISIHLPGDTNDGLAQVIVDGNEVARLDMNSNPPDRVLLIVSGLPNTTHTIKVNDLGIGPSGFGDDVHCLGAAALRLLPDYKWNQPPQPTIPDNLFYGWNEPSFYQYSQSPPYTWTGVAAADDWMCTGTQPITRIRWWGSYIGWQQTVPPPPEYLPTRYVFTIWTDVPAGQEPFSHPGNVVWRYEVAGPQNPQWVGMDFDPRGIGWESCFLYSIDIPPELAFCQPAASNIYWISIAAVYDQAPPFSPLYKWGWKTRPRDPLSQAPDDAVRIYDPILPGIGMAYVAGDAIWWPTVADSWDMSFELLSAPKWTQPPDLNYTGVDVNASHTTGLPQQQYILADDFRCSQTGPIGSVTIWGSWFGDIFPPLGPGSVNFTLSIHKDIPMNPPSVPYSRPGQLVWTGTFAPGQFQFQPLTGNLEPEGWMNPPSQFFQANHFGVWRYDFTLPPSAVQEGTPTQPMIYWLDVHAVPIGSTTALFGWKTSQCRWNDGGVWGNGVEPFAGPWNQLLYPSGHPFASQIMDFAFMIGTDDGAASRIKWSQPPQPYSPPDAFNGWNELSVYGGQQIAADDWVCTNARPVTDIHWWGSWIGWAEEFPPYSAIPPRFHIGIWTDVPSDPTQPGSFSHPDVMIWQYICENFTWEFVGWDFDPRNPTMAPDGCYRFNCDLPEEFWFYQESGTQVYWLSIAPIYDMEPSYPWGWKTTPRLDGQSPDDGVRIFAPTAPSLGMMYMLGQPIWWPTIDDSWDLAFALTTEPSEACCLPDGTCIDTTRNLCLMQYGGIPQGTGTNCAGLGLMITDQPANATVCELDPATFTVQVCAIAPIQYQWYKATLPPTPVGGNSNTYSILSVQLADAGGYYVDVTDGIGNTITSTTATLTVWDRGSCDMDQNGVVNGLDIQPFIDTLLGGVTAPYSTCAADADQNFSLTPADIPGFVSKLLGP